MEAEQGDAEAQYELGEWFLLGEGFAQDSEAAAEWYRKAGEQGHAKAQYQLALMYEHGDGVRQNYYYASLWYKKAAGQGHPEAKEAAEETRRWTLEQSTATSNDLERKRIYNRQKEDRYHRSLAGQKEARERIKKLIEGGY